MSREAVRRYELIIMAVLAIEEVSGPEIFSDLRTPRIVEARAMLAGTLYHMTSFSQVEIAGAMGRREHSTIQSQIQRFDALPPERRAAYLLAVTRKVHSLETADEVRSSCLKFARAQA